MYVYVKCSTSENNTLDHVYSNIKNAYRAVPLPQLGQSDHLSLPSGVKQSPSQRLLNLGLREVSLSYKIALHELNKLYLNTRTKRNICNLFHKIGWQGHYEKTYLFFPNQKPWMVKVHTLFRDCDCLLVRGLGLVQHCQSWPEERHQRCQTGL